MPEDMAPLPAPFRVWGEAGARPVLALHCSLAHSGAWSGLAKRLPDMQLTAFDQPGHGRAADWDGQADLQTVTTRIAAEFAEQLGGGAPIDLIGHSFGATVCLRLALERPDLVQSLVLVEPVLFAAARASGSPVWPAFAESHGQVETEIRAGRLDAAVRLFHAAWGGPVAFDDLAQAQQDYMRDRIALIAAQGPALLADSGGILRYLALESLGVPVLLIEGAASPPVIGAIHDELARRLPQVTRVSIAGAGHMLPITHPAEVAEAITRHLAGV